MTAAWVYIFSALLKNLAFSYLFATNVLYVFTDEIPVVSCMCV